MPDISVVIATRDRLALLREAVASVERQSVKGWELVVVDDDSHDGTAEWVSQHPDERVRLVRLEHHAERSRARNRGLAIARGRYVLFLDDDDRLLSRALEVLMAALDRHPGAVAAVGGYVLADAVGNRRRMGHVRRESERVVWRDSLFSWNAPQGRTLLRAEVARGVGGFVEDEPFAEDWEFWLRVARKGRAVLVPDTVLEYRFHPDQQTARTRDPHQIIERMATLHRSFLEPSECAIADRMQIVRARHDEGRRALGDLDFRRAVRGFASAIRTEPRILLSPFVRPQVVGPLGKALAGLVIGKKGTLAARRAASFGRRVARRNVWSKPPDDVIRG